MRANKKSMELQRPQIRLFTKHENNGNVTQAQYNALLERVTYLENIIASIYPFVNITVQGSVTVT